MNNNDSNNNNNYLMIIITIVIYVGDMIFHIYIYIPSRIFSIATENGFPCHGRPVVPSGCSWFRSRGQGRESALGRLVIHRGHPWGLPGEICTRPGKHTKSMENHRKPIGKWRFTLW